MTKAIERSGTLEIPGTQYPYISNQSNFISALLQELTDSLIINQWN